MKIKPILGATLLIVALLSFGSLNAQVVVKVRPAHPVKVKARPTKARSGHIWVAGNWKYNTRQGRYVWKEGTWLRQRPGFRYREGHWAKAKGGHRWVPGVWVKV